MSLHTTVLLYVSGWLRVFFRRCRWRACEDYVSVISVEYQRNTKEKQPAHVFDQRSTWTSQINNPLNRVWIECTQWWAVNVLPTAVKHMWECQLSPCDVHSDRSSCVIVKMNTEKSSRLNGWLSIKSGNVYYPFLQVYHMKYILPSYSVHSYVKAHCQNWSLHTHMTLQTNAALQWCSEHRSDTCYINKLDELTLLD